MKNLLLLILATVLTLFKVSMADDLEDYVNKGHVEILVEALKYSDAGMFEEAANEIKNTNNEILLMKVLKERTYRHFLKYAQFVKSSEKFHIFYMKTIVCPKQLKAQYFSCAHSIQMLQEIYSMRFWKS